MKRILVVVAIVMALTFALSASSAGAQPMMGPWYHVRVGDTLSGIAMMYGVSPWAIAQANGILNPNVIFAGQVLFIPAGGGFPGPAPIGGPGCGPVGPFPGFGGGYTSWSSSSFVSYGYGGGYPVLYGGFQPHHPKPVQFPGLKVAPQPGMFPGGMPQPGMFPGGMQQGGMFPGGNFAQPMGPAGMDASF